MPFFCTLEVFFSPMSEPLTSVDEIVKIGWGNTASSAGRVGLWIAAMQKFLDCQTVSHEVGETRIWQTAPHPRYLRYRSRTLVLHVEGEEGWVFDARGVVV